MSVVKVTFVRDWFPNQGAGYTGQEEAAFRLEDAIALVVKGIAKFSDPANLETHREAVEVTRRSKPTPFVRRMVPGDSRRWG
jgi:hypothetical protein